MCNKFITLDLIFGVVVTRVGKGTRNRELLVKGYKLLVVKLTGYRDLIFSMVIIVKILYYIL